MPSNAKTEEFGKVFHHLDIIKGLKNLNSYIMLNETNDLFAEKGIVRMGTIFYKDTEAAIIERGNLPEFDVYGGERYEWVRCAPHTAALDPLNVTVQERLLVAGVDEMGILFDHFSEQMGDRLEMEVMVGDELALATRQTVEMDDGTKEGAKAPAIMLEVCSIRRTIPSTIERVGWRTVLQAMMNLNIDGINKRSLEKEFKVDLDGNKERRKVKLGEWEPYEANLSG